jgi:hypothetical protein
MARLRSHRASRLSETHRISFRQMQWLLGGERGYTEAKGGRDGTAYRFHAPAFHGVGPREPATPRRNRCACESYLGVAWRATTRAGNLGARSSTWENF